MNICLTSLQATPLILPFSLQLSELKPGSAYVFLVRAENSHGLSVPSPLSPVIRTLGKNHNVIPPSELAAARSFLSGKVSF